MRPQLRHIDITWRNDRRHASAPIRPRHMHTIYVGFLDAREHGNRFRHFGGCNILALPAERVPNPVHKIEIAKLVLFQKITGPEPGISLLKHITQNLLFCLFFLGVSVKSSRWRFGIIADLAQCLPNLSRCTHLAETVSAADRCFIFNIKTNNLDIELGLCPSGNPPDGAYSSIIIHEGNIAFRCPVKLQHVGNFEPFLKGRPDLRAQTIADDHPKLVLALLGMHIGIQQITAQFTDILEERGLVISNIVPELTRREFPLDNDRAPHCQHRPDGTHTACGVIQRQANIHPVFFRRIGCGGKTAHHHQQTRVGNFGSLRVARCTACINIERRMIDRQAASEIRRQALRRPVCQNSIQIMRALHLPPRRPDSHRAFKLINRTRVTVCQFSPEDQMICIRYGKRMHQRPAGQVCIDKRGRATCLDNPKPGCNVFSPVFHQKCNRLVWSDPLFLGPARISVRQSIKLPVGKLAPPVENGHIIGFRCGKPFNDIGKCPRSVFVNSPDALQRPQRCPQVSNFI